ncbi:hypothetical protein Pmar_PMAR010137 [Perkinsus marinus ATCC 50983]|uniref:Transmembrane protein n=1 Tax=Perkinsus marinus (strain ATCC 50983 / TXsc) TaxID=423536 RepID=C5K4Y1_PERM5|nr:hypothetical protein Pmar_PMAR010137 [Perkinsus marinus ATCC 50983]EER20403.1 hypothetical protein Pmar_PMAR010137 [Perkinsus marinus ATCC 50983]|eukprot:XP_002788607.1 hypothetical protein Pmar_PMAR010137 [Perkinsus marinus ATCC 50983]
MPRLAQDAPPAIRAVFSEAALELRGTELEWWAEILQWTERELCRGSSSRRNRCLYSYHQDFYHYDVDPADFHCVTKMGSGCSQVAPSERPRSRLAQLGPPEVLHGVLRAPAGSVTIGNPRNGYSLSSALISQINSKAEIQLIDADGAAAFLGVADRQLHIDLTSNQSFAQTFVASPRLGDLRLRVTASTTDFVSVIARQEPGGRLGPYVIPTIRPSEPIEWLASGHHGHLQSLLQHHSRDDVAWLWRFLGILSMWLGTALLLSPLGEAEPSCMALLCVACFAGAVISALLATIGATLFASLPIELLLAVIGVAAAFFAWRSYKAPWFGRAHYYEYYYGDDASSVEMPLVGGREYDGDSWFERRLDNRCIDSDDDEIDKIGAPKDVYLGRQARPSRQLRHDLRE